MNNHARPSAILIGDEIGQLKRIDYGSKTLLKQKNSGQSSNSTIQIIELVPDEPKHPSKSIVSIHPLKHIKLSNRYFLVARKDHEIFIYDDQNKDVHAVKYINDNKTDLIGGRCVDDQNIVIGFKDGTIKRINVENDLCFAQYKPNSKAVNLLGIDGGGSSESITINVETPRKRRRLDTTNLIMASRNANEISNEKQNILTLHKPNWNVQNTYLTCFEVNKDKLAIGGFNADLKVFDLNTGQTVFGAKSVNTDWLGIRHDLWISGIEWLEGDDSIDPHLIATCSRSEPFVRIYDIKQRQRKPAMTVNLKHLNNVNNESNPLSFTSMCSLGSLAHYGQASSSLIVGTTLGRMIAIDLRTKNQYSKVLGSFKGFCGGSVRDIKSIRDSQISHKVFSCSIDRFVRVHTMTRTIRNLDKKIYVKTRPTCLYPIISYGNRKQSLITENQTEGDDDDEDQES